MFPFWPESTLQTTDERQRQNLHPGPDTGRTVLWNGKLLIARTVVYISLQLRVASFVFFVAGGVFFVCLCVCVVHSPFPQHVLAFPFLGVKTQTKLWETAFGHPNKRSNGSLGLDFFLVEACVFYVIFLVFFSMIDYSDGWCLACPLPEYALAQTQTGTWERNKKKNYRRRTGKIKRKNCIKRSRAGRALFFFLANGHQLHLSGAGHRWVVGQALEGTHKKMGEKLHFFALDMLCSFISCRLFFAYNTAGNSSMPSSTTVVPPFSRKQRARKKENIPPFSPACS